MTFFTWSPVLAGDREGPSDLNPIQAPSLAPQAPGPQPGPSLGLPRLQEGRALLVQGAELSGGFPPPLECTLRLRTQSAQTPQLDADPLTR